MDCRGVVPLGVVLMLALTSCAPRIPRPSGPSRAPWAKTSRRTGLHRSRRMPCLAQVVTNPAGVLTLSHAQALALLHTHGSQRLAGRSALGRHGRQASLPQILSWVSKSRTSQAQERCGVFRARRSPST